MNRLSWGLVAAALLASAVAVQASNNLEVAVPAGVASLLLIAVAGASEVHARSRSFVAAPGSVVASSGARRVESDSLLQLRRAFRSGALGRASILATVRALERDLSPFGRTPLTLDEEQRVLSLPSEEFRSWVDEHLARIEAST